jgi:hypothetical protein
MDALTKNWKGILKVLGFVFGIGTAWGSLSNKVDTQEQKILEMRSNIDTLKVRQIESRFTQKEMHRDLRLIKRKLHIDDGEE